MLSTILRRMMMAAGFLLAGAGFADAQAPNTPSTLPPPVAPMKPASPAGTRAVVVDLGALDSVIGKNVRSATGDDLGHILDVLADNKGVVRAAVIDFGGVLGVGSRKVAIDWRVLEFDGSAKAGAVRLVLTRDQIRMAPEYRSGEPIVILQGAKADESESAAVAKPSAPGTSNPTPANK